MDKSIILQYKKAVEQNFRNIKMRDMIKGLPYKISEDQTDRNPLPFVTDYLRAEEALINEIELGEVKEKEIDFLMRIINENEKPETSYPYLSFAANEIYLGMQELKERLTAIRENKSNEKSEYNNINPLDFIDGALLNRFLDIEKKIAGENGKWNESNIRLAAFCELLFESKFLNEKPKEGKNRPVKFLINFAKSRYGKDIETNIRKGKETERENHKTKIVSGLNPLKNYLK